MLKIAFCDNESSILNDLSVLLDHYRVERNCKITYSAYLSPLELLADTERGQRWDILLLDILMPGENGLNLAKEIRDYDENVKIIFLTSSPDFAVQSYAVGATFYLLKPVHSENLFPVLDHAIDLCIKTQAEKLILKCKTGITALAPDKIEYCEVTGRSLILHLQSGKVLECNISLGELEEKLRVFGGFLRVHRSYLVNMDCIQSISYRAVLMESMREIPLPHGKYSDVKTTYLAYALGKDRVIV